MRSALHHLAPPMPSAVRYGAGKDGGSFDLIWWFDLGLLYDAAAV